jgi:hypothetical protein
MHRPNETNVCCAMTADERAVLDAMLRATGCSSYANLVRTALWSLADHLDIEMPDGVFDLHDIGRPRRRNPQIRQTA